MFRSLILIAALAPLADDTPPAKDKGPAAQQQRLEKIQQLVGSWRGVAQPQRASTKDSWLEEAEWAWSFGKGGPALVARLPKAKFYRELRLAAGKDAREYTLAATPLEGEAIEYRGTIDDQQRLVLSADKPQAELPQRLTFRFVAGGDRLLVLMERKSPSGDQLQRLAEVGFTRQGSGFGKGSSGRECVVTGGTGTIEVTHKGQTYYVCCTGCRDYFYEKPDEILAEYAERKAAEKTKQR
jgi:YHS domain-containing protein